MALRALEQLDDSLRLELLAVNDRAARAASSFVLILLFSMLVHGLETRTRLKASNAAVSRKPLCDYGPELSERRHRHR
ncbi:hypothetical protein D9M71_784550 [compost metagenome]